MFPTYSNMLISVMSFIVFCSSYVFIIQPMVFYLFGFRKSVERKVPAAEQIKYRDGYVKSHEENNSGIISAVLPFYAFGIFAYFAYTIFKLISNRSNVNAKKKKEYLKDYYRNFRYVPEKGNFQMDSDYSDGEKVNGLRNFRPEYDIGWSPAPDNLDSTPDIYRSIAGLPKDLEYLLKKADDENLDDGELTQLNNRLEQMEVQMKRLLEAVNASASNLSQKVCYSNVKGDCVRNGDSSDEVYSAEENNAL